MEIEQVIQSLQEALGSIEVSVQTLTEEVQELLHQDLRPITAVGPHQLNTIFQDDTRTLVTVTYPVGSTTVMSIQPDGTVETREEGEQGPYESALKQPDRLVFAPLGVNGAVYIIPLVTEIPNV